jgi:hypothetical protein
MEHLAVNKIPYFRKDRAEAAMQKAIITEELRSALLIVVDAMK